MKLCTTGIFETPALPRVECEPFTTSCSTALFTAICLTLRNAVVQKITKNAFSFGETFPHSPFFTGVCI